MKAVLCPVCFNGSGRLGSGGGTDDLECHGCNGKGWVEVQEEYDEPMESELSWRRTTTIDLTKCSVCGGDKNSPALTSCPKGSHYGTYCLIKQ